MEAAPGSEHGDRLALARRALDALDGDKREVFILARVEQLSAPEIARATGLGRELAQVYIGRGVSSDLAYQVADQLMAKDALGAHARDELGISELTRARPIQAALTSAATFALGAAMPLVMVLLLPHSALVVGVSAASLLFLALLGAIGARAGGAA